MYNNPNPFFGGFIWFLIAIILACMVFWHAILVLILPLRFNAFVLIVELILLYFIVLKIVWPH